MAGAVPFHGTAGAHGKRPKAWAGSLVEPPKLPVVRHCWFDGPYGRQAALLLGWRQIDGVYYGRIAVAVLQSDGWIIVEMAVPAKLLTPSTLRP